MTDLSSGSGVSTSAHKTNSFNHSWQFKVVKAILLPNFPNKIRWVPRQLFNIHKYLRHPAAWSQQTPSRQYQRQFPGSHDCFVVWQRGNQLCSVYWINTIQLIFHWSFWYPKVQSTCTVQQIKKLSYASCLYRCNRALNASPSRQLLEKSLAWTPGYPLTISRTQTNKAFLASRALTSSNCFSFCDEPPKGMETWKTFHNSKLLSK